MTTPTVLAQGEVSGLVAPLPGFVVSTFNPLLAAAAEQCLLARYGEPPVPPEFADTAVIVVSASGDTTSAAHVAETVDTGGRVGPLMFFQSVPNGVVGYLAARWGLHGPVVCFSPTGDPLADGLDQARLVISDGDAEQALVILVELARVVNEQDVAKAVLVGGDNP